MKQRIRVRGSWRHIRCAWADCKRAADRRITVAGRGGQGPKFPFCCEDHRQNWLLWKADGRIWLPG